MCGHVGFDGFEYISDIWAGGLVGTTVRVRFWRSPAARCPPASRSGSPGCTSAGRCSTTGSAGSELIHLPTESVAQRNLPQRADRLDHMYIGTSIFLIGVGAVLAWAVTATVAGIDIQTAGVILMVVGVIGLIVSLLQLTVLADRRRRPVESEVVREREYR